MKVAFFVHCFFPEHFYGTETYTLDLAKYYRAAGHDVVVVSAVFQGEPARDGLVSRYEHQGIPVVCIDKNSVPHTRVKETYYQPDMRPVLEGVLRELKPDVVHVTHLINHTAALLEVTQQLGIATYATFTDFFGFCLNNKLEAANGDLCAGPSPSRTNCMACYLKDAARSPYADRWVRRATTPRSAQWIASAANFGRRLPGLRNGPVDGLLEDIARRPDTLLGLYNGGYKGAVAPTRFLKKAYEANGIATPMRDIWFGVDIDRSSKPRRAPGHRPVIGFIGQIAPHKGTDLLIEAFRRLPKDAAELRIHGPADQDPTYMASLRSLAEGHKVSFLGTFPSAQMASKLAEMDVLVIPSRWYENSPLVLLNALATHTPVLVSDVAGMTEFLEPGRNGYAFDRGSADALFVRLRDLLAAPEGLYALAETTGYERTIADMAKDTLDVYAEIQA
ncbi:glycosyltransferase family 4 protein [Pseudorhodoferax sp. Leaf274]|uniref:glycosyltransferase family 4 protein n=1 Tax=Pseudorhodoferax sp. Leaf274 TaxID=1736318 RepID=UPI0007034DCB|nr:glycosyltransferase family 4 protein [Pseudorhodoferax sp. Leaf274]KQP46181.1 glycosyl transferase [Pseudorhodoferax sp. Leaf274]